MESVIPFLVAMTSAILGAFAGRFFSQRKERLQTTIEMFQYYHSPDMAEARKNAWVYLQNTYKKEPCTFKNLFSDRAEGIHVDQYHSLIKILYFWHMFWVLHKEGQIIPRVAKRMLSYQFKYWYSAFIPLYEKTLEDENDRPEWLAIMEDKEMGWLLSENSTSMRV